MTNILGNIAHIDYGPHLNAKPDDLDATSDVYLKLEHADALEMAVYGMLHSEQQIKVSELLGRVREYLNLSQTDPRLAASTTAADVKQSIEPFNISPFETLEGRLDSFDSVGELVAFLDKTRRISHAKKLANRVRQLSEIAEDESDQEPISLGSLREFVRFLKVTKGLKFPAVVMTPVGNIRVQWRKASNKLLVLEFYSDGATRFVVFAPSKLKPKQTFRLSGSATADTVMEAVDSFGVRQWAEA